MIEAELIIWIFVIGGALLGAIFGPYIQKEMADQEHEIIVWVS